MKIRVTGTQNYKTNNDKIVQEFDDAEFFETADEIVIKYKNNSTHISKNLNYFKQCNEYMNIEVEINAKKVLTYDTPYGKIILNTFGEEISYKEKPLNVKLKYRLAHGEDIEYLNTIEIIEI